MHRGKVDPGVSELPRGNELSRDHVNRLLVDVDVLCPSGAYERLSDAFLNIMSLPATHPECLIKILIFNSLKFKEIAFKQCPPLGLRFKNQCFASFAIPMICNHLGGIRKLKFCKVR